MDELEYTCVKLETLKICGDMEAEKATLANDEELYRAWDMYRLEIASALSCVHDVINISKEREQACMNRMVSQD